MAVDLMIYGVCVHGTVEQLGYISAVDWVNLVMADNDEGTVE